jgi:hypothetical protein
MAVGEDRARTARAGDDTPLGVDELDPLAASEIAAERAVERVDVRLRQAAVVVAEEHVDLAGQRPHEGCERAAGTEQDAVGGDDGAHRRRSHGRRIRPDVEHVAEQHDLADLPAARDDPRQRFRQPAFVHRRLIPARRSAIADVDVAEHHRVLRSRHGQLALERERPHHRCSIAGRFEHAHSPGLVWRSRLLQEPGHPGV